VLLHAAQCANLLLPSILGDGWGVLGEKAIACMLRCRPRRYNVRYEVRYNAEDLDPPLIIINPTLPNTVQTPSKLRLYSGETE